MKVAIYCRVSSDDQNVDQQVEYLKAWCRKRDLSVVRVVADKMSGRAPLTERDDFARLLSDGLVEEFEAVVVYNTDRLTRNWDDVTYIEKYFRENWEACRLISSSDEIDLSSASGRMMFRIKMAVSCFMPEDMREKQSIGIARAKREGKYTGRKKGAVAKKRRRSE